MDNDRFSEYLALAALDRIGGANTRELADDLAREWNGAAYVRVDVADRSRASVAAVAGNADSILQRLVDTPAGERIRMKCGAADLRSVITDTLAVASSPVPAEPPPIDMILFCPRCGTQHVDTPETERHYRARLSNAMPAELAPRWMNPPHRSHLCHQCHAVWRPADVPTNGVARINTRGKEDLTWTNTVVAPAEPLQPEGEQMKIELGASPTTAGQERVAVYKQNGVEIIGPAPDIAESRTLTDAEVDQFLREHVDDPVDEAQLERVRRTFNEKLSTAALRTQEEEGK